MNHFCHAKDCRQRVKPALFMCAKHWRMVTHDLGCLLMKHYVIGQEVRKDPSDEYLRAARACIEWVAKEEKESK